jgi:dTDP-4-dehydrorhamnose reductase
VMDIGKIIITGAKGQLGSELSDLFEQQGYEVYGYSRSELDITNDQHVKKIFSSVHPDIVIHAGAFTKVDLAETQPEQAYLINGYGTRNIAVASQQIGAKLVYISTDYVFDGRSPQSYDEFSIPNPISVYGKSKLAGEQFVRDFHQAFFIIRTSWVYGKNGKNFVKTMLNLGQERDELTVVNDQIGSPTYTKDLSDCIARLIQTDKYGIYHVSNTGECSWFEFARAIFDEAELNVHVKACTSQEFQSSAPRPSYSVLDHMAIRLNGFEKMRPWREALCDFIREIK